MAAPAFQSVQQATGANSATSVTVTKPASTAAGDLLLAFVAWRPFCPAPVITPPGTGWVLAGAYQATNTLVLAVFWKIAGASEPSSYAFTFSGTGGLDGPTVAIERWTGADQVAPINVIAATTTGSSATGPAACPTPTTTVANCAVVHAISINGAPRTVTGPGADTLRWQNADTGSNNAVGAASDASFVGPGATPSASFTFTDPFSGFVTPYIVATLAIAPTGTGPAISIVEPIQYQCKVADGGVTTFTVSVLTTATDPIEVSTDGGSTFATLGTPVNGFVSGSVTVAKSLTDYTFVARVSTDHSKTASVANIAVVGAALCYLDQSNENGRLTNLQTAYPVVGADANRMRTGFGYGVLADPTGALSTSGSYVLVMANVSSALLGDRVVVVNITVGGTSLAQWQKGAGTGYYENALAHLRLVTTSGSIVVTQFGPIETDASNGTTQSAYHTGMVNIIASWLSDVPLSRNIWRTLQHCDPATATQPNQDAVNAGVYQGAGSIPGRATGDIAGLTLFECRSVPAFGPPASPGNNVHILSDQQAGVWGGIAGAVVYIVLNPPRVTKWNLGPVGS